MSDQYSRVIRDLRGFFAKFPHVIKCQSRIRELVGRPCNEEEPDILAIVGETGVGKSTVLKRTSAEFPRIEHDDFTEIPIVYVEVPAKCTLGNLVGAILKAMGSPFWDRGRDMERTYQLLKLLRKCKVRVLVLDEANHTFDRGRARTHYLIGDWIKQLSDQSRVHLVLAGIPSLRGLIETNEQLANRLAEEIVIEPFGVNEDAVNSMVTALSAFNAVLGDIPRISLPQKRTCQLFAFATAGRTRGIRRLLVRAVEIAAVSTDPRIDHAVLAQSFREVIFPGAPDERNPFATKFNGRPLNAAGEPYFGAGRRQVEKAHA